MRFATLAPIVIMVSAGAPAFTQDESTGGKHPTPVEASVQLERNRLAESFEDDYLKASADAEARREFAAKLLELAESFGKKRPLQFAALVEARELAVRGRDLETALRAIERIDALFEPVDVGGMRHAAVLRLAADVRPSQTPALAEVALEMIAATIRSEDGKRAGELLEAIRGPIKKYGAKGQKARWRVSQDSLTQLLGYQAARKVLKEKPADPAAHEVIGRYLAFVQGKLELGLPHLARGPEGELREIAALDLSLPTEPAEQLRLGDRWVAWGEAEEQEARRQAERRAQHWYRLAQPSLDPLELVLLEEKLAQLEGSLEESPGAQPLPPSRYSNPRPMRGVEHRTAEGIEIAMDWLVAHQSEEGHWDSDGFHGECGLEVDSACDGSGNAAQDIGVTGLALLALLSRGHPAGDGRVDAAIRRGVDWLAGQQQEDGLIGTDVGHSFIYCHAIATLALLRAQKLSPDPELLPVLRSAIAFIQDARNPYGAWRYDVPPVGDNDTSVTGWMIQVLVEADALGIEIEKEALIGGLNWIEEVTDPETARVGYDSIGAPSARVTGINENFSPEFGEAMTAVGLTCNALLGRASKQRALSMKQVALISKRHPKWDVDGLKIDQYYWYHATEALFLMRKKARGAWSAWYDALCKALLDAQIQEGHARGSWDPAGAWGHSGGRVYSTSMAVMALARPAL